MRLSEFDYELPPDRIAQHPAAERDASRLLLLDRAAQSHQDRMFRELPSLVRGDELVVVNDARVFPARLFGRRRGVRAQAPGKRLRGHLSSEIEVLLTREVEPGVWEALVRPGRKIRPGERILFDSESSSEGAAPPLEAEVIARGAYGARRLHFLNAGDLTVALNRIGHIPLPPYIGRADVPEDRERYQTIFAQRPGAVAAPTAGLHFTPTVVEQLRARGVEICPLTLFVGPGTFQPVRTDEVERHEMQPEAYEIPEETAAAIRRARAARRPVLAVGTTVVRALESAARAAQAQQGRSALTSTFDVPSGTGEARIYLYPGAEFFVVNQLLTNFHLPKSTLLLLVSAFAGRELIMEACRHAVRSNYRFYSYGDCMLIR
ncbi:MAG TPA: tRNA preQ1(34) S-adenosylmethionine ribosyltransferase-isomerase QueA [Candidatus Acidoferrales bacterium]|nr:tRNA preQ1(34) S-adenosylmethionine ribosyltransferase-isomerase QueA [Candidatus Acidoferrales bacterium]